MKVEQVAHILMGVFCTFLVILLFSGLLYAQDTPWMYDLFTPDGKFKKSLEVTGSVNATTGVTGGKTTDESGYFLLYEESGSSTQGMGFMGPAGPVTEDRYFRLVWFDSSTIENSIFIIGPESSVAGKKTYALTPVNLTSLTQNVYTTGTVRGGKYTKTISVNTTLTASECYDSIIYVDESCTVTLPPVATGMFIQFAIRGEYTLTVNPDDSDRLKLATGTAMTDGESLEIISGSAGAKIPIAYESSDGFQVFNETGGGTATTTSSTTVASTSSTTTTIINTPTVVTASITDIEDTTATGGGNVTSDGGSSVTAKGVCWAESTGPDLDDDCTSDGTGTGTYVSSLTGLTAETHYYVRAFATNSSGTGWGSEEEFDTEATPGAYDFREDWDSYRETWYASTCATPYTCTDDPTSWDSTYTASPIVGTNSLFVSGDVDTDFRYIKSAIGTTFTGGDEFYITWAVKWLDATADFDDSDQPNSLRLYSGTPTSTSLQGFFYLRWDEDYTRFDRTGFQNESASLGFWSTGWTSWTTPRYFKVRWKISTASSTPYNGECQMWYSSSGSEGTWTEGFNSTAVNTYGDVSVIGIKGGDTGNVYLTGDMIIDDIRVSTSDINY